MLRRSSWFPSKDAPHEASQAGMMCWLGGSRLKETHRTCTSIRTYRKCFQPVVTGSCVVWHHHSLHREFREAYMPLGPRNSFPFVDREHVHPAAGRALFYNLQVSLPLQQKHTIGTDFIPRRSRGLITQRGQVVPEAKLNCHSYMDSVPALSCFRIVHSKRAPKIFCRRRRDPDKMPFRQGPVPG